jgi:malonyl-CoA O-methyltransferase
MEGEFSLDRKALVRAFDRAAAHDAGDDPLLQGLERVGAELLDRLQYFALDPSFILDLGAGRCRATLTLQQVYPRAQVIALDLSLAMLRSAPRPWWPRRRPKCVAGEAERLPLRDHSVDLVYSNLLLPFCDQPHLVFREAARVLKQGGVFIFSSLGPDTLQELRLAWDSVDQAPHVNLFLNLPQLGDALMQSGLVEPVMDTEQHCLGYPNVQALMRDLKRLGAHNVASTRVRTLTSRRRLQEMVSSYESARAPAGISATFEIIFGAAFASGPPQREGFATTGLDEVAIPVSSLRKHVR